MAPYALTPTSEQGGSLEENPGSHVNGNSQEISYEGHVHNSTSNGHSQPEGGNGNGLHAVPSNGNMLPNNDYIGQPQLSVDTAPAIPYETAYSTGYTGKLPTALYYTANFSKMASLKATPNRISNFETNQSQ